MTAILEDVATETFDAWGTLNTAVAPTKLQKNHTPRAINVWPDEKPGSIKTVAGYTHIGDLPSGNPCLFMYTFRKSDGTSKVLVSDNATVWSTTDFVTFTSIVTGLSAAFQLRAITLRDKVWLTNGQDSVRTYDGSSVVVLDGSASTPTVPKGKFIAAFHERIWLGDIPNDRSACRFSALVDSSGSDIAPDNASAWPSANEIQFGQDDGDVLCGLKLYQKVLHVFKAESIYRVDGYDEFSYQPTKTNSSTGSRIMESIQERDNLLEFIGKNGIYEFDGANSRKVSDAIESVDLTGFSFNNIQQSSNHSATKAWTLAADFTGGTLTKLSSTRVTDSLVIDGYTYGGDALPASSTPVWTKTTHRSVSESVGSGILTCTAQGGTLAGTQSSDITYTRTETGLSNTNGTRFKISAKMNSSNASHYIFVSVDDNTKQVSLEIRPTIVYVRDSIAGTILGSYSMTTTDTYHTYDLVLQGTSFTLYIDTVSRITGTPGASFSLDRINFGVQSLATDGSTASGSIDYLAIIFATVSGPQWLSDVYHITDTISSWSAFQANYTLNGGTLTFYYRNGTTSVNCLAASWTAITPGATIGGSTSNVYIQVRADFAANGTDSPQLDDVTIGWNSGTASQTTQLVASVIYKDRYWLSGALTGSTTNNAVIVRGKRVYEAPWVQLSGFNITAFCIYNEQLYAASSANDDILQLDQNNSLAGAALDSYWETRDDVGGKDEIFQKRYPVVIVAGKRQGNYSLTVDISIDGGVTYSSTYQKTISLAGTGHFESELRYSSLRGKQIRVRVRTNGIDTPFEVDAIRVFWRKSLLR